MSSIVGFENSLLLQMIKLFYSQSKPFTIQDTEQMTENLPKSNQLRFKLGLFVFIVIYHYYIILKLSNNEVSWSITNIWCHGRYCRYEFASNSSNAIISRLYTKMRGNPYLHCWKNGQKLKVFVAVLSPITNFERRETIRKTWGAVRSKKNIKLVFFISTSSNDTIQQQVNEELLDNGDIVQGNYTDQSNETLKVISIVDWINKTCRNVKFVMKTNDNVLLNTNELLHFVHSHHSSNKTVFGYTNHSTNIDSYLSQPAFLFSTDFFIDHVNDTFKFEDNLSLEMFKKHYVSDSSFAFTGNTSNVKSVSEFDNSKIAWNSVNSTEMHKLWNRLWALNEHHFGMHHMM